MVKHIVMFKLREKTRENQEKVVTALKGLKNDIEELQFLEVGVDFKESERSYDIVLTTHFNNREDLASYAVHPKHLVVVQLIKELCTGSVVVDYEY